MIDWWVKRTAVYYQIVDRIDDRLICFMNVRVSDKRLAHLIIEAVYEKTKNDPEFLKRLNESLEP